MKKLTLFLILSCASIVTHAQSFAKLWQKADSLISIKNFKESAEVIMTIRNKAIAENNSPEKIRTILAEHNALTINSDENNSFNIIYDNFQNHLNNVKGIEKNLIASFYAQYLLSNISIQTVDSKNYHSLPIEKRIQIIDSLFKISLDQKERLIKEPLSNWSTLLTNDKEIKLTPTLYHLLALKYLDFLKADESNGSISQSFEQEIQQINTNNNYKDAAAYMIYRPYMTNYNVHNTDTLLKLLPTIESDFNTYIYYQLARHKKPKEALALLKIAKDKYPQSPWIANVDTLIEQLSISNIKINIPAFVPSQEYFPIKINHKNSNKLYIRVYDISKTAKKNKQITERFDDNTKQISLNAPLVYEEVVDLKHFDDGYGHLTKYKLNPLPYGRYQILVSNNIDFKEDGIYLETISSQFYVSDMFLSAYEKTKTDENSTFSVLLIDRKSGKPLANKNIELYIENDKNQNLKKIKQYKTNKTGELYLNSNAFKFDLDEIYLFNIDEKQWISLDELSNIPDFTKDETKPSVLSQENSIIMTDRAIYRPGQTLHFKAILYTNHFKTGKISDNKELSINLKDANNQKIKSLTLTTNSFGSINGKFDLPTKTLNGHFVLELTFNNKVIGTKYFNVEEYKRPTFKVSFETNKNTYTKTDTAIFIGKVESLTGAIIPNSTVKYTINTNSYSPTYFHKKTENSIVTDLNGEFRIAIPLNDTSYQNLNSFSINIDAEVRSPSEEIQKASTRYSYNDQPKVLQISTNSNQKEYDWKSIDVTTTNNNGFPLPFSGHINIYKYEPIQLPLGQNAFDFNEGYDILDTITYQKFFPNYYDKALHRSERQKTLVETYPFDTNKSNKVAIDSTLFGYGEYLAEAISIVSPKDTLRSTNHVKVLQASTGKHSNNTFLSYSLDKRSYNEKDTVRITFHSDLKELDNLFLWEIQGTDIKPITLVPFVGNKASYEYIVAPYSDKAKTQFEVLLVKNNNIKKLTINIPYQQHIKKNINIITKTFRDKITPGQKEKWSFTVTQNDTKAEVIATMYDSSIDQFSSNSFYNNFNLNYPYFNSYRLHHIIPEFTEEAYWKDRFSYKQKTYQSLIVPQIRNYGLWSNYVYPYKSLIIDNDGSTSSGIRIRGASTQKKMTMTGSVAINSVDIQDVPAANVMDLLQGRVPGLNVQPNNGTPGIRGNVILRGISNINISNSDTDAILTENAPLFIIDGVINTSTISPLSTIPTDQIRSVEVLKDSEAFALYGNKGAKGVIIIITKSGKYSTDEIKEAARLQEEKENRLNKVNARTNLQETAFFYPELYTDEDGNVSFEFDSPEALTKWKLLLFAHTKDLQSGNATYFTQTQKQLMVQPNLPRFMRVGDQIVIKSLLSNLSDNNIQGSVKLQIIDPRTNEVIQNIFASGGETKDFSIDAKNNNTVSWSIQVPDGYPTVILKIVAASDEFSDGEQHELAILPNDILISETQKIVLDKDRTNQYQINSQNKNNIQAQIIVQSNPILEILSSLEYLKNYPYECAEQTASKWFGIKMIQYVQKQYPAVSKYFNTIDTTNISSSLREKMSTNELSLEEMPWLRAIVNEEEKIKQLASLFNNDNIQSDLKILEERLNKLQNKDGSFVWFDGGNTNLDISVRLLEIFGKVHHLDKELITKENQKMISKLKSFLNKGDIFNAATSYNQIIDFAYANQYWNVDLIDNKEQKSWIVKTLSKSPLNSAKQAAGIAAKSLIVANHYGLKAEANAIFNRLDQEYVLDSITGMYWKSNSDYYNAISLQTYLIEAYKALKPQHLKAMADWLFYNKTHNNWKTTWMSVDAIYALLVANDPTDFDIENKVSIWVDDSKTDPKPSGIGQVSIKFKAEELDANKFIKIENLNNRKIYGSIVHQYFMPLEQIEASTKDISVTKHIMVLRDNKWISTKHIKSGEKVKIRLEVISNKNLNFVHLKDNRAAGFEPEYRPSGYQFRFGNYYFNNKDASTNYFIDYLTKGKHVFEYEVKTNNIGLFNSGITQIECMYNPAVHARSENLKIEIKE